MANRVHNYSAGPAALPLEVLERAQAELPNYGDSGMSVMEFSHRGPHYSAIHEKTTATLRELMAVPDTHKLLYLQGGASQQFAMIPMNLRAAGQSAGYVMTGSWSKKALKEAKVGGGAARVVATSEETNFHRVPPESEWKKDPDAAYLHVTTNNTIFGTQMHFVPETGVVPLIADMSSDILSRPLDVSKFGLIYAGAQKNLGPSGVTLLIMREDLIERGGEDIPIILRYRTHAAADSLYNTPPCWGIYVLGLVAEWVKENGGAEGMAKRNQEKVDILYGALDDSHDYYRSTVERDSRSSMNVTFRLPTEDLEKKFIAEAGEAGFKTLKGHRSVGGIRISMYNATGPESIRELVGFMSDFASKNR